METLQGPSGPRSGERSPAGPPVAGVPARWLVASVRLYQAARSGRPSPCRFWPTCSDYAIDAVSEYGAARGGWMTVGRLARCHPWGGSGVDPVPPAVELRESR